MASAPQDLSEVYLLEKRKGEIEEVNIIPNGKRRCVPSQGQLQELRGLTYWR